MLQKMGFCLRCFLRRNQVRWISTKRKIIPEFNTDVHQNIEKEGMNPKKHPGVMKILPPRVPDKLLEAIRYVLRDKPVKTLVGDGAALTRYLEGRHPPLNEDEMRIHVSKISKTTARLYGVDLENMNDMDIERKKTGMDSKMNELFKKYTYNWKPINYDLHTSLVYLVSRAAPEYAVLCRIFNEIAIRDKSFQPKSLFDFGSGVGIVSWAAKSFWNDSLKEFYCVDASCQINDIAQGLIQGGKLNLVPPKGVYYRQFLPSKSTLYDVVVTAHTLFELPSKQARFETLLNLWQKTKHYLIIVERGTNAGFKLINEAKDLILFSNESKSSSTLHNVHVFAPCPHDQSCPRLMTHYQGEKETPCNFVVSYSQLPLDDKENIKKEKFSFVILKKGLRGSDKEEWPRIVRPVIKRSGHCICRFCTAGGKLQEIIFSAAKHGKIPYRCARSSKWGDVLPIKLNETEIIVDKDLNTVEDEMDDCDDNSEDDEFKNDDRKR